jgi:hypothetical protein
MFIKFVNSKKIVQEPIASMIIHLKVKNNSDIRAKYKSTYVNDETCTWSAKENA